MTCRSWRVPLRADTCRRPQRFPAVPGRIRPGAPTIGAASGGAANPTGTRGPLTAGSPSAKPASSPPTSLGIGLANSPRRLVANPMPTGDCTIVVVVAATTPSTTGTPIRALMSTARSAIPAQPSTITSQPSSATARAHSCVIAVRAAEPGISSSRTGMSLARTLLQNPDAVAGGQVPRPPPNGPLQRRHDGEPPAEVGGQLCRWANRCRSESPWRVRGLI